MRVADKCDASSVNAIHRVILDRGKCRNGLPVLRKQMAWIVVRIIPCPGAFAKAGRGRLKTGTGMGYDGPVARWHDPHVPVVRLFLAVPAGFHPVPPRLFRPRAPRPQACPGRAAGMDHRAPGPGAWSAPPAAGSRSPAWRTCPPAGACSSSPTTRAPSTSRC